MFPLLHRSVRTADLVVGSRKFYDIDGRHIVDSHERQPGASARRSIIPLAMKTHMSRREFGQVVGAAALTAMPCGLAASPQNASSIAPVPAGGSELCFLSALELATRIRQKQVSAREVMTAHLAQIERINPKVNAIVTLVADRAMAAAARADDIAAKGGTLGVLHGLPVAHKDLVDT